MIAVIFAIVKCNCYSIPYTSYPHHVGGETASFKQHLQCGGSVNYNCVNQECDVQCGDGTRVRLKCREGSVSVSSINQRSTVSCGPKISFPPCFPFCDHDNAGHDKALSQTSSLFQPCFPFCNEAEKSPLNASCFPFCEG